MPTTKPAAVDAAKESAEAPAPPKEGVTIASLRDVSLELVVEIGRTTRLLRDVLGLAPGEILSLDRPAGSPADLYVNGTLFARGQVVEAADSGEYAIRITEILARGQRSS